ncbi:ribonuclease H-like protein [Lepidopterella palustris CBS 459.81]|uniref:ribonuclease H n=1 Tax=Lepidopterella palustris CBS 459.81 TaxID=1314670 RepID=A0A8E2E7K1_9PEZI|nr:ribonuclease H-like protein [Lepidopterella palustris CBS 459.81]
MDTIVVNNFPSNVDILLGGHDLELLRKMGVSIPKFPSLEPAENFTRFVPPNATDTPEMLFMPKINNCSIPAPRFTRRSNPREFLIYTDGACIENGNENASAGCAFVFRPEVPPSMIPPSTSCGHSTRTMNLHTLGACNFRLESGGPNGEIVPQTSNRAELRAIIAVLQFRLWHNEGFQRLVIATDSSYAVEGSTNWIRKWQQNGWQTSNRRPVKNRDLWEVIIKELGKCSRAGLEVQLWLIPRSLNSVADRLAKEGAALADVERWANRSGVVC